MKNKRKKYLFLCIGILGCVLLGIATKSFFHYFYHVKESELYKIETSYRIENQDLGLIENSYEEGSGEYYFLEGLKAYDLGNYVIALENFEKADKSSAKDRALSTYLLYYRNLCMWEQEGVGDVELVEATLKEAQKYVPLANDQDFLWNLISSVSLSAAMDKKAIALIEDFISDEEHLELGTWAWLKNYIAMLEYNNEEYANSIRNFYDVEVRLEDKKLSPEMEYELQYAKEYIANIYVVFENYEKAAILYQEIFDKSLQKKDYDSYACCINMASAYLEIEDSNNARKAIENLEKVFDKIDPTYAPEVEATIFDLYANICIMEGKLEEADSYLKKAEAFYENNQGRAFFGGDIFIVFTRGKLLLAQNNFKEAQSVLEELLKNEDVEYLGLETEIYDVLKEIYQKTNQKDKLIQIYETILEHEEKFITTTQREYLRFSEYYRENFELKTHNMQLYRKNLWSIMALIFISIILILVLVMVRFLSKRNLIDQLTGVYNRKKLNLLLKKYEKKGTPSNIAVAMLDVDYFKRYNDTYGHPAGDVVLQEVSTILKTVVRRKDIVIRYGGEEFLMILEGIKQNDAEQICHNIYDKLKMKEIPHSTSEVSEFVTMSMGLVFQKDKNSKSLEKLIGNADANLYQAKEAGRNQLVVNNN